MSAAEAPAALEAARAMEAELRRLEPIAEQLARRFFLPGGDADDVRQIAREGLWRAIERWDGSAPLAAFAYVVARRRVMDAVTGARRQKRHGDHAPLYLSDGGPRDGEPLGEQLAEPVSLAEQLERRSELRAIVAAVPSLSPLERRWLAAVVNGEAYARHAGGRDKRAENAVDRARRKLRRAAGLHAAV